jgi:prepilin-type N-terminal cleavage/methylation domain-containing protein
MAGKRIDDMTCMKTPDPRAQNGYFYWSLIYQILNKVSAPLAKAFTLSELLITVAVLGFIATMAIPKIIQSIETNQKKAIFKEAISTITAVQQKGMLDGQMTPTNLFNYFKQSMNYVKACQNNLVTEGCTVSVTGRYAFILNNGAMISDFDNCCDFGANGTGNGISIDYNGEKGPNIGGQDRLNLNLCFGTTTCWPGQFYQQRPGTVIADANNASDPDYILYNLIYAN